MARKPIKATKKVKPNLTKPVKEVINLGYLDVYHEVLKHEDVLDIDLDIIFETVKSVIREHLIPMKMVNEPDGIGVEVLVSKVMAELCD